MGERWERVGSPQPLQLQADQALTPEVSTPLRMTSGHTGEEGSFSGFLVPPSAMAQPLFMEHPPRTEFLREAGSARAMEKLEAHLKLAEYSSEAVQKMSNLQKFNNEQCGYLADKLKVVIRSARLFLEVLRTKRDGTLSVVDSSRPSEIFKLMVALAKQIESFAQGCCNDKWIRAAMSLTFVSDYVSSLGFNLELCKLALREDHAATGCLTLFEICKISEAEAEIVEKKALADVKTLIEKVTLELNSLRGSNRDLASYLLQRLLKVEPGTPIDSDDGTLLSKLFAWVVPAEQVGRGASATVYKATWLGTQVAKKTFHGSNNPDFLKEIKILSKLRHPNITSMFCCAKNERNCSIIMELMDGDLYQAMQRRCETKDSAPFLTLEAIDIMLQIGEGVNYLHSKGIVHRDLKSMNILVKDVKMNNEDIGYMHAKVTDFGVSKTSRGSTTYSNQTFNIGTFRWMPPEVMQLAITGNGLILQSNEFLKYPFKCDTYSFGMVCYEILTGHVPFPNNNNTNDIKRRVLKNCERPQLPSCCPPKLKALIEKCWAQEPRERPTFMKICQELKHLKYLLMTASNQGGQPIEAEEVPGSTPAIPAISECRANLVFLQGESSATSETGDFYRASSSMKGRNERHVCPEPRFSNSISDILKRVKIDIPVLPAGHKLVAAEQGVVYIISKEPSTARTSLIRVSRSVHHDFVCYNYYCPFQLLSSSQPFTSGTSRVYLGGKMLSGKPAVLAWNPCTLFPNSDFLQSPAAATTEWEYTFFAQSSTNFALYCGCSDGRIEVWEPDSSNQRARVYGWQLTGHEGAISGLAVCKDGILLSVDEDEKNIVRMWRYSNLVAFLDLKHEKVKEMACTREGNLYTVTESGRKLWCNVKNKVDLRDTLRPKTYGVELFELLQRPSTSSTSANVFAEQCVVAAGASETVCFLCTTSTDNVDTRNVDTMDQHMCIIEKWRGNDWVSTTETGLEKGELQSWTVAKDGTVYFSSVSGKIWRSNMLGASPSVTLQSDETFDIYRTFEGLS